MTNCWPNGTLTCCWNSVPNKFWNSNSFCFLSFSEPSNWFQTIWMWTLLRMLQTTYYDLVTNMFQFAVPESADLFPRWTGDIVSAAHSASSLQLWTLSSIASRFFFFGGAILEGKSFLDSEILCMTFSGIMDEILDCWGCSALSIDGLKFIPLHCRRFFEILRDSLRRPDSFRCNCSSDSWEFLWVFWHRLPAASICIAASNRNLWRFVSDICLTKKQKTREIFWAFFGYSWMILWIFCSTPEEVKQNKKRRLLNRSEVE